MIPIEEFKKVEITIGEIISAEEIPNSDKLLKLTVNFAEEKPRTILSGIKKYFPDPQALVGLKCGFVTNLEPREMMGMTSEGMILAASTDEAFALLTVSADIPSGTKIK